jgi:hypothetical protein
MKLMVAALLEQSHDTNSSLKRHRQQQQYLLQLPTAIDTYPIGAGTRSDVSICSVMRVMRVMYQQSVAIKFWCKTGIGHLLQTTGSQRLLSREL